jgi:hypothetical protein
MYLNHEHIPMQRINTDIYLPVLFLLCYNIDLSFGKESDTKYRYRHQYRLSASQQCLKCVFFFIRFCSVSLTSSRRTWPHRSSESRTSAKQPTDFMETSTQSLRLLLVGIEVLFLKLEKKQNFNRKKCTLQLF